MSQGCFPSLSSSQSHASLTQVLFNSSSKARHESVFEWQRICVDSWLIHQLLVTEIRCHLAIKMKDLRWIETMAGLSSLSYFLLPSPISNSASRRLIKPLGLKPKRHCFEAKTAAPFAYAPRRGSRWWPHAKYRKVTPSSILTIGNKSFHLFDWPRVRSLMPWNNMLATHHYRSWLQAADHVQ